MALQTTSTLKLPNTNSALWGKWLYTDAAGNITGKTEAELKSALSITNIVNGITAGSGITITESPAGSGNWTITNSMGAALPDKYTSTDSVTGNVGDVTTGLAQGNLTGINSAPLANLDAGDVVIFANGYQGQVTAVTTGGSPTYNCVIISKPVAATWGTITGTLSSQSDLNTALAGKQASLPSGGNSSQYLGGDLQWHTLSASGATKQVLAITGNNSTQNFTLAHTLNSTEILAQVWTNPSSGSPQLVLALVEATGANQVTVYFDIAPPTGTNYKVILIG